ncbi:hypothetical protein ACU61A_12545 [Pseudonocardia sichuanensis]
MASDPPLPDWVVPTRAEAADLHWLAYRTYLDDERQHERERGEAIAMTVSWLGGGIWSPITGRPEQPVPRGVAVAEMWAAMRVCDGGGTPVSALRAACAEQGVPYYPCSDIPTLEHGWGVYQALSWLMRNLDGWEGGRRPPMEIPIRAADGTIAADDSRSQELAALVADTRARAAEALGRRE